MKPAFVVLVVSLVVLVTAACGVDSKSVGDDDIPSVADGGNPRRPNPDLIESSMEGSDLVADLDEDEAHCFAQAIHEGELSDDILAKVVFDRELDDAELDAFDEALSSAANRCGFSYESGG